MEPMFEITNSRSGMKTKGSLNVGVERKLPPRSAQPLVKVSVDYRDLSHRKNHEIRPKTASPFLRSSKSDSTLKFKKKSKNENNLEVQGIGAQLNEDSFVSRGSVHLGSSVFSEKTTYKMRSKLSYMCHEIEGSRSIDYDNSLRSSSRIQLGVDEIEQRQPFSFDTASADSTFQKEPQIPIIQSLNNTPRSETHRQLEELEEMKETNPHDNEDVQLSSPAHDPSRFFIDLWLSKHQPVPDVDHEIHEQETQLDTFYLDLLSRLQTVVLKARLNHKHTKSKQLRTNKHKSLDNRQHQSKSLRAIGIGALEVIDILIKEKGQDLPILPAIRDALLPLIFDKSDLAPIEIISARSNDGDDNKSGVLSPTTSSINSIDMLMNDFYDYPRQSTYLEQYVSVLSEQQRLQANHQQLISSYEALEQKNRLTEQQLLHFQQNYEVTAEKLQLSLQRTQELVISNEDRGQQIRTLETALSKEQSLVQGLQEKVKEFESEQLLLKIEQKNVQKERQKFESEWSSLLIENDRLRKEVDNTGKIKHEMKRQLNDLSEKYHSLLSKLQELQTSFHQHFEVDVLERLHDLIPSTAWIDFRDEEYASIQKDLVSDKDSPIETVPAGNSGTHSSQRHPRGQIEGHGSFASASFDSTISQSSQRGQAHRKSIINPALARSKSISTIIRGMDDTINSEAEQIEQLSLRVEDVFHQIIDGFQVVLSEIAHCQDVRDQFQSRLQELYQHRQKLLQQQQQQLTVVQQQYREEQRALARSHQEVQETLRKTIHEKEFHLTALQLIRKQQDEKVSKLQAELLQKEYQLDHCREERNHYEALVKMQLEDTFSHRQEESFRQTIAVQRRQSQILIEEKSELKKELNLQLKEINRLREFTDSQIYLLMKEKEKALKEVDQREEVIKELKTQQDEIDRITTERMLMLANEIDSWKMHSIATSSKEDSSTQTQTIETTDSESYVTASMIKKEMKGETAAGEVSERKKSRKISDVSRVKRSNRGSTASRKISKLQRLSMHSISESENEDNDNEEEGNRGMSTAGVSIDSDSDLSSVSDDSSGGDDDDHSESSLAEEEDDLSEEIDDLSRKRLREEKRQQKKQAKEKKRQQKALQRLAARKASSVMLDPRLFTEERRKSYLKQSIKNSILFDQNYVSVNDSIVFYDRPEMVKEFMNALHGKLQQFDRLKQSLQQEKTRIQSELQQFQEFFFQEKELIMKEFKKKVGHLQQETIAMVLNQTLQQIITSEQHSIAPEYVPRDVEQFTKATAELIPSISSSRILSFEEGESQLKPAISQPHLATTSEAVKDHTSSNTTNTTVNTVTFLLPAEMPAEVKGSIDSSDQNQPPKPGKLVKQSTLSYLSVQPTKSDEQIDKVIDLKALIKVSKKLGQFLYKSKSKRSVMSRSGSVATGMDSSLIESSSEDEEDEDGFEVEDESLHVDGFESLETLQELKKEKKKRKTLKPQILLEIDPKAQVKIERKNRLREFSHDRFYHAGTQTIEDMFSWASKQATAPVMSSRRRGVISNSFLLRNLGTGNTTTTNQGTGTSHSDSDSDPEESPLLPSRRSASGGNSRLSHRLKSDTIFADLLTKYYSKEQISQPFLQFIRKHEKIYAREIGLMKIALREYKRSFEEQQKEITHLLALNASNPAIATILSHLLTQYEQNHWMFDPTLFIRQSNNNPLEDCIDTATQLRIIESYQELLSKRLVMNAENRSLIRQQNQHLVKAVNHLQAATKVGHDSPPPVVSGTLQEDSQLENKSVTTSSEKLRASEIDQHHRQSIVSEYAPHLSLQEKSVDTSTAFSDTEQRQQQETLYHLINHTIKDLLLDLTDRMKQSGGWKALLYRSDGSIDVDLDHRLFPLDEQVQIQTEKVHYLTMKVTQRQENYEKIIDKLNKQNQELLQKMTTIQKQLYHYQHPNYNNNLDKLAYYRNISPLNNTNNGNGGGQKKEMAVNTDTTTTDLQAEIKYLPMSDWQRLEGEVESILEKMKESQQRMKEMQTMLKHRDQLISQLKRSQQQRQKEQRDSFFNDSILTEQQRKSLAEQPAPLLKKALVTTNPINTSTIRDPSMEGIEDHSVSVLSTTENHHHRTGSSLEGDIHDEEQMSAYSKEIINNYLTSSVTFETKGNDHQLSSPSHTMPATQSRLYSQSIAADHPNPGKKKTRAQSAGIGKTTRPQSASMGSVPRIEYLAISGPKPLSQKGHSDSKSASHRPWSSHTWRQIEKASRDMVSHSNLQSSITLARPSSKASSNHPSSGSIDRKNSKDGQSEENKSNTATETDGLFQKLMSMTEILSQPQISIEATLSLVEEKGEGLIPKPEASLLERQVVVDNDDIEDDEKDGEDDKVVNVTEEREGNEEKEKEEEQIEATDLFNEVLPGHSSSPSVVFGVGETAIDEGNHDTSHEEAAIKQSFEAPPLFLREGTNNSIFTSNSTYSAPPLVKSITFHPPSFPLHLPDETGGGSAEHGSPEQSHHRQGIYAKLYQQMFSSLEALDPPKSPMPEKPPTRVPIIQTRIQSKDIPKSIMRPEMMHYASLLFEKFQQHQRESEKLWKTLSSLERSYEGMDFFSRYHFASPPEEQRRERK